MSNDIKAQLLMSKILFEVDAMNAEIKRNADPSEIEKIRARKEELVKQLKKLYSQDDKGKE